MTITSAELAYVVFNEGDTANVNEVAVDWTESSTYSDFGGDAGVDASEYGALIGTASGALPLGTKTVNVTASLGSWSTNPTLNRGWILIPTASNGVQVRSSEYATTISEHPKLTVTYTNVPPNQAPTQPVLVSPLNNATGVGTSPVLSVTVSDPDSEPMNVTFYGRVAGGSTGENFTIVVLPDTQNYSSTYPATFTAQTQWIVNNQDDLNIVYVAHEGDIVNDASVTSQWTNADAAMDLLDAANIPYGVVPGNHDEIGGTTNYNNYFGVNRFCTSYPTGCKSFYGGSFPAGDNQNNYTLFTASGMDFIVINLDYTSPAAGSLDWADDLAQDKQHPPRHRRQSRHCPDRQPCQFLDLGTEHLHRLE